MLQSLLAKFGLNAPNISTPSPPVAYTVSVPPGFQSVSAQLSAQPTYVSPQLLPGSFGVSNMGMAGLFPQGVQYPTGSPQQGVHYPQQGVQTLSGPPQGVHLVPGTSQPPVQFTTGVQQQQGGSFPGSVHLGQSPSMPFHPSQLFASGSQGSGQATLLPNAFNTTTLQEPASGNWNMDTGASSHLNDSVHCLSDILNMCIYPSVAVGDGRFIPVTNSGHSVLSTPFRPLRLNNVLITPNIVKNLISVRQFVRDNSCTVEFDPFGFSVKDFITRRVLLRCDSTGELYPVTKPSTIPHAFLTSQYTWHQRLGHPGSKVLRRLVSSDSISCNKEKLLVLCHACQLGKHVKLPFVSSSSSVTSCKYAMEILERAHMVGCNSSRTPVDTESKLGDGGTPVVDPTLYRSLAGSLQYLTFTRPDITYVVQQVCLYMHDPREPHFSALKRILRYVQGTLDYGLQLFSSTTDSLIAYSDADWVGCPTTRRSTSGYCIFLGNNLLSWSSKRQLTLSRSCAEAEYRGVANAVAETCWIQNLLRELHTPLSSDTIVYCDNVSVVYLSSNPVQHQRTKHIEIDIYFIRDLVATGQVRILHVPSRFQYADIFIKGLPSALFDEFRDSLSVRCTPAPTTEEC
ncbi:ribonuclease H-like domain-containing protein [Tanacetum coccineum]